MCDALFFLYSEVHAECSFVAFEVFELRCLGAVAALILIRLWVALVLWRWFASVRILWFFEHLHLLVRGTRNNSPARSGRASAETCLEELLSSVCSVRSEPEDAGVLGAVLRAVWSFTPSVERRRDVSRACHVRVLRALHWWSAVTRAFSCICHCQIHHCQIY